MGDANPSKRSQRGLDWLNFFIADVETTFGPFVAVFLTTQGWGKGAIGSVITINSSIALASQIPAGWLMDHLRQKRLMAGLCLACIAAGALLIALFPNFWTVAAGEALHGTTSGTIRIAMTAIGLGLVGRVQFHNRLGRNHRYMSFGNAATAAMMGLLGHFVSPQAPFFAGAALCVPAGWSLASVNASEIDYRRARQASTQEGEQPWGWHDLLGNRPLLVFSACLFLFQFSNASLLPLAGDRLAEQYRNESELVTSALVIVPQLTTALIAAWVARMAESWGRKPLLLLGFGALLLRTGLFAFALDPWFLVGIQILGGLTAAMVGILTPLLIADYTEKSGRYNVALGACGTCGRVGATISTTASGFVAQTFGFTWAFGMLAVVAAAGMLAVFFFLSETAGDRTG